MITKEIIYMMLHNFYLSNVKMANVTTILMINETLKKYFWPFLNFCEKYNKFEQKYNHLLFISS